MRIIRNIITGMSFRPVYRTHPVWMYETATVEPYDHSVMDAIWPKHFNAWQAQD